VLGALRQFPFGVEDTSLWATSPCGMKQVITKEAANHYINTTSSLQPTSYRRSKEQRQCLYGAHIAKGDLGPIEGFNST
jgi:hypothetical protein